MSWALWEKDLESLSDEAPDTCLLLVPDDLHDPSFWTHLLSEEAIGEPTYDKSVSSAQKLLE